MLDSEPYGLCKNLNCPLKRQIPKGLEHLSRRSDIERNPRFSVRNAPLRFSRASDSGTYDRIKLVGGVL